MSFNNNLISSYFFDEGNEVHLEFYGLLEEMLLSIGMDERGLGDEYVWDDEVPARSEWDREISLLRKHLVNEFRLIPDYWVYDCDNGSMMLVVKRAYKYVYVHTYDSVDQLVEDLMNIDAATNFESWEGNEIYDFGGPDSFKNQWLSENFPNENIVLCVSDSSVELGDGPLVNTAGELVSALVRVALLPTVTLD